MSTSARATSPCAPSSSARRGSRPPVPTSRCSPRSTAIRCLPGRDGSSWPPSIPSSPTTRAFTSCFWIRYGRRRVSGHSKWSTIKHKKGAADAKRGKLFSKLTRAIIVAAKEGGGDPAANLALQNAIEKARSYSMPKDNIERAIARGAGSEGDGDAYEPIVYEGYLGGSGSVAWLFERRGVVLVPADGADEDELTLAAADGGADDVERDGSSFHISSAPEAL